METLLFIQTGMGVDVHGQDINVAAERAVKNAIHYNSMPGIRQLLPEENIDLMKVHVKFAIPADINQLDEQAIQKLFPYGSVTVETMEGGMKTTSGIFLTDQQDNNDLMYIVNVAIEVGY
ncbi:MAG TPA: Lin0512 family protein [Virgibacillus sp.]|nr:Lin0512 family protein [Virgibacillus sp.]